MHVQLHAYPCMSVCIYAGFIHVCIYLEKRSCLKVSIFICLSYCISYTYRKRKKEFDKKKTKDKFSDFGSTLIVDVDYSEYLQPLYKHLLFLLLKNCN